MKLRTLAHLAMLGAGAWLAWYGADLLASTDRLDFRGKLGTGGNSTSDDALIILLIGLGLAANGAWELLTSLGNAKRGNHPDA
jgi:hypothetical protein